MISKIQQSLEQFYPELLRIRQHIHQYPELSFQEEATSKFIIAELEKLNIPYQKNIAGTGIVALVKGKKPERKCIAIRAELDALPITELNDTAYKSKNIGVMHACGHDVHSTCLLGVGKLLQEFKDDWEGTVKLIFQPGEEMHPGGGSLMIAENVLENPKVKAILALHVYPHLPAGTLGFRAGQYMASTDEIHIKIIGKGGHAALPHQSIDPISIAAQCIVGLQQIVSRKSNPVVPAVLSFGKISAGTVNNVIPDELILEGTLRTMDEKWREEAHTMIKDIVESTAKAYGAKAEIRIPKGYPSLYNDPKLTQQMVHWAQEYIGAENVKELSLRMTADDFAFYSHQVPGCYFRLGTNLNNEKYTASVHNAHFDIEPKAMLTGVGTMTYAAMQLLNT